MLCYLQEDQKHHPLLLQVLARHLQCQPGDIVDFELNLCDCQPGVIGGEGPTACPPIVEACLPLS